MLQVEPAQQLAYVELSALKMPFEQEEEYFKGFQRWPIIRYRNNRCSQRRPFISS